MPSTSELLVDPVEVAAARSIVQKCWELRSVAICVILVVGWFLGCMGLTAGIEVIFHDFVVSSPLVLNQMFLEIVHLPKVVAWFFYGFSGIFLLAAWWKAFRMSLVAAILAFSIYNLFYGFGTLCFGAALGFRPNDRTLYLLFAVSMATPGWLRLCGMRRIAIFGLILVLILGIVSAFRSEVFSLYNMGTFLLADVTVLFPWCVGWTLFEIGYGIFSLVRRFRLKSEDENFDFE